jgi:hypothetical protein
MQSVLSDVLKKEKKIKNLKKLIYILLSQFLIKD